jgi:signal transduction histidine kinase
VMHHTNKKIDFMDYQYVGNAYFFLKKYDQAIVALEEAAKRIKIERPKALVRQRNIYFFLKGAYYEVGNLKASMKADATYDSLVSVINDNDRVLALLHLREKYSLADKEAQLKRFALENEITDSQKRLLFGSLVVTLILVGIVLFFSIRLRKTNTKLLELQQGRDKFYTIIAHDLRSPMNSLNDMGALLHYLIQEGKTQELDKVIQQIENMRLQTQLLLNNLFEWGKSQYFTFGANEPPQMVDVVPLFQELHQTYLPFAQAQKITLTTELPANLWLTTAPGGLMVSVRNLLDNALKNTPAGGKIIIRMSESSADSPAQPMSKLSITDTGKGIAPDQLHYLQQVFAGKIKPEVGIQELGLGMVLIHHFVQKNKATLTIESEVGKGTCFRLMWEA